VQLQLPLTTAQIVAINTADIVALSTAQMQALETSDVDALTTTQIAVLETSDLNALTTVQIQALTTDQIQALTTSQFAAMETGDIAVLTTAQFNAIETSDIVALTTAQIVAINTADIAALTTAQIEALSTDQIHAITTDQIQAFHTDHMIALTTSQIQALTTADIHILTTVQLQAIETTDVAAMTTSQLTGLMNNFTTDQIAALTTEQTGVLLSTPIVLDLDGNGIQTAGVNNGVAFDITGSGHLIQTGWVAGKDGLLVRDINHDGAITDGGELFGSATKLASGTNAKDGFEALSVMDTNHDGVINMSDAEFKDLQIWVDSNHDGISQASELHSLQSLGVAELHLKATQTAVNNNGNWIFLDSTYTGTDGTSHQMSDVWFEKGGPIDISTMSTAQVEALTPEQVSLLSTDQIHAMTPDQMAAFSTADIAVLSQDQVQALTLDDVAALHDFGKVDSFSAPQLQAIVKSHLTSGLDDILFSGNVNVHANAIAGSDQLQLIVTGDATGKVELIGQPGNWKDAGSMLVNGAESHIYNNEQIQIVIQGSVTAVEKKFPHWIDQVK